MEMLLKQQLMEVKYLINVEAIFNYCGDNI